MSQTSPPAANGYTGSYQLEFERPLIALERQIGELEHSVGGGRVDLTEELNVLRENHTSMLRKIYSDLEPWQVVRVARHPARPQAIDYIEQFVTDFCELHGDRRYGDDPAIITGFGRIGRRQKVMIVASHKGKDTADKLRANFGHAHPEGYRKAMSKMKLAEKFGVPVICLIDTPGAYPGIGAEERGQAEAIAFNLREMSRLRTPILAAVIGEGGSGGALGIGVADRLAMMQHSWFSVISPEGCASILWRSAEAAPQAAAALRLTARDNLDLGAIDEVIEEPLGAAHRNPAAAGETLEQWITRSLKEVRRYKLDNLLARRYDRLRKIGAFES